MKLLFIYLVALMIQSFFKITVTTGQAKLDCYSVAGGTAFMDECGVCTGGTTGIKPCKALPVGDYYIKILSSGLCLEDATAVKQQNCFSKAEQLWKVTKVGNFYQIQNTATYKYLTVAPEPTSYVFSTFKGDKDPGMKLSIYTSKDGLNFTLLSDTGFEGTSSNLRDPSIMRHTDGKYYVTYTNAPTESCCGRENYFSIASSTDLVHWTNITTVLAGVSGVAHTWAPEWYVEGNTVRIIANIDTQDKEWVSFKGYIFTALNTSLTSWSGPVSMGIGPNYIDTYVLKMGSTYHAFTKNETTKYLEHATSSGLTGPWKFIATGNWSGWGSGIEGNNIVKLGNGTYRIFFDSQGVPFMYAESNDLMKWSGAKNVPGIYNVARHGTVINLTTQPPLSGTAVISNSSADNTFWRMEEGSNGAYNLIPSTNFALAAEVANGSLLQGGTLNVVKRHSGDRQGFTFSTSLVTGIKEHPAPEHIDYTSCFPNPFYTDFEINVKGVFEYSVYDVLGSMVEKGDGKDSAKAGKNLKSGIYLVKIFAENGYKVFKVNKD